MKQLVEQFLPPALTDFGRGQLVGIVRQAGLLNDSMRADIKQLITGLWVVRADQGPET
jgi:hypothetical protein